MSLERFHGTPNAEPQLSSRKRLGKHSQRWYPLTLPVGTAVAVPLLTLQRYVLCFNPVAIAMPIFQSQHGSKENLHDSFGLQDQQCCCWRCFWDQPPAFFIGMFFGVLFNASILTLIVKFLSH
jgi:hypothetical protein